MVPSYSVTALLLYKEREIDFGGQSLYKFKASEKKILCFEEYLPSFLFLKYIASFQNGF